MLLPSDEGNGGDAGQRMRASHLAGLTALKSSESRGQLCHPMGSGIRANRGCLLEKAFAATAEPVTKAPRWARDQRRASGVKTANTGGSRDCLDEPALFTPVLEEPRDRFDAPAASPPAPKKPRSLSPRIVRGRESRAFYNRRKSVGSLAEKPNWSPPPRWARDQRRASRCQTANTGRANGATPPTLRKARSFSPRGARERGFVRSQKDSRQEPARK